MKKKIIVVEDDDDTLFMLLTVLQNKGYEVLGLKDGSMIMGEHFFWPDLFILDKDMEYYDGITLTTYLKSKPEGNDIPIMMVSGDQNTKEAVEAGIDFFLPKPFDTEHLLGAVESLIASPLKEMNATH